MPGEIDELLSEMRAHVPKQGDDYIKAISLVLRQGEQIKEHVHSEHTVLYYVEPSGPIVVNGDTYQPEKGEFLYLKPGTPHSVPKVSETRVSLAMLVEA